MNFAPELSAADRQVISGWWQAFLARPDAMPDGLEIVQSRLIRAVGRGRLPDSGTVYAKLMGFPRFRDRLRYVHRALPATHEARLLRRLAAAGLACPEVLAVAGARRALRVPRASLLVTRALPGEVGVLPFAEAATFAARLAAVGLFHPDLNQGNFARLESGEAAVLDLQSARWPSDRSLSEAARMVMATKLLHEFGAGARPEVLVSAGLVALSLIHISEPTRPY